MTIGARTLSYLAAGTFPNDRLVVFLHAFPLNAGMWVPQLRAMPAGWSAVAPDLRGFGESDPDGADYPRENARLEDYADDAAALLAALGANRAAVCGCSMGGYTALAMTRRHPARVSGLLLADTRATADPDAARASRRAMLELLDRNGPAAVAADMKTKLVGSTSMSQRPGVVAEMDRLMAAATASGVGCAIHRIMNRQDTTADLAAFRGPVTVVVGEEDTLTPPAEASAMAAAVPGSTLVTIPGAGHLSNLEAPDAFNAALHAWLNAIAGVGV
jgi:3-oxoadipate enol-lactonase